MRATVSRRVDGLKVHLDPSFTSKTVDEIEPAFSVEVLERNPDCAPDWSRVAYDRKFNNGTRKHFTGWCKTGLLVFDWEKAPPPPQPDFIPFDGWSKMAMSIGIALVAVIVMIIVFGK